MNNSSTNLSGMSLGFAQFKAQALQSMLFGDSSKDLFATAPVASELFDNLFAAAKDAGSITSTTPSGLDASQPFIRPGQNVMTVINRVEVSFKAQFSELSELNNTLENAQDMAQKLLAIDLQTSNADIKSALQTFIETYNAGVNRFAAEVAQGGILEGSQEAMRARFATQRDINNPLIGADGGLRGGMHALGVSVNPKTGLAILDEERLDTVLAHENNDADARTIADFAKNFIATIENLNAQGNPQDKQLANLDRAIHWINSNRDAVQQEFGVGKAATPNGAFAKAAAAYALFAR